LWLLCVVRQRFLRQADHLSRRVLPTVMRRCVWYRNLNLWGAKHQSIVIELKKNRRYITGRISCMPLIVTVNTIAECPRTDCNIYSEGEKQQLPRFMWSYFNWKWRKKLSVCWSIMTWKCAGDV